MIYNNNIFSGQILRSMTKKFIVGALIGHLSVFSEYVYCGNEKKTGNDGVPTLKDFPYRVVIKKLKYFHC